jgi:hypothetical protein
MWARSLVLKEMRQGWDLEESVSCPSQNFSRTIRSDSPKRKKNTPNSEEQLLSPSSSLAWSGYLLVQIDRTEHKMGSPDWMLNTTTWRNTQGDANRHEHSKVFCARSTTVDLFWSTQTQCGFFSSFSFFPWQSFLLRGMGTSATVQPKKKWRRSYSVRGNTSFFFFFDQPTIG